MIHKVGCSLTCIVLVEVECVKSVERMHADELHEKLGLPE